MKETKELLMEDYKKVSDLLTVVQPDDEVSNANFGLPDYQCTNWRHNGP